MPRQGIIVKNHKAYEKKYLKDLSISSAKASANTTPKITRVGLPATDPMPYFATGLRATQ